MPETVVIKEVNVPVRRECPTIRACLPIKPIATPPCGPDQSDFPQW